MKHSRDIKRSKGESGAVALISIFMMTVVIMLTAFVIDYGLFNYKSTKLQNATDSVATAVAANLDASDSSREQIARSYLTKNGFDGASEDIDITIETKGVVDEGTINDDEYISAGYLKVTVDMKQGMIFSGIFDSDSMRLKRTSYVKCDIDYIAMPRALKYTLFAGSTGVAPNGGAAMQINGRTGDVTNFVSSKIEGFINGVNESIVQPIIGIFGGEEDYTDLVHINLSEAITDGDVHSNAATSIGIQALNASRTKDGNLSQLKIDESGNPVTEKDEEGNTIYKEVEQIKTDADGNAIKMTDSNGDPILDVDGNYIYETEIVQTPVYVYETETNTYNSNDYDDYGQVTYTSVGNITFNNTSADSSTRVYTQNQQYLEQTQVALNILNNIDYTKVNGLEQLKTQYTNQANIYIASRNNITTAQADLILAQKDNLAYESETKTITLNNQEMIVYQSTQGTSNSMISEVNTQEEPKSYIYNELVSSGNDIGYDQSTNRPLYDNIADNGGSIDYEVNLSPCDSQGNPIDGVKVKVVGRSVSRSFAKTNIDPASKNNPTATGLKFALNSTFQGNLGPTGYIPTPNMKPYFVREINRSIRNSTQSQAALGDTQIEGQRSIKQSVASMTNDLINILEDTEYTDSQFANLDGRGQPISLKTSVNSYLFAYNKVSAESGLIHTQNDMDKTLNGFNIFSSNGVLTTPSEMINQKSSSILEDSAQNAVNNYYNSQIKNNDGSVYETNYAYDAVERKKNSLNTSFGSSYNDKKEAISKSNMTTFDDVVGTHEDVFIGPANSPITKKLNNETAFTSGISIDASSGTVTLSYDETLSQGAKWADGSTGAKSLNRTDTTSGTGDIGGNFYTGSYINNSGGGFFGGGSSSTVGSGKITVVNGDLTVKNKNLDIGADGSNSVLIVTGKIILPNGQMQLRANSIVYCLGDISCKSLYTENGSKIYCAGNFTLNMSGVFYNNCANLVVKGNLKMSGDKDFFTLKNYAQIYVGGNFESTYKTYHENAEMYVLGQFINSTTDSDGRSDNFIETKGTSKIYIGNGITVCATQRRAIWAHDGSATISIYSANSQTSYDLLSGVNDIDNSTPGGNVYIGLSDPSKFVYHATEIKFNISGGCNLYAYCGFNFSNNGVFNCSGTGTTFIQGGIYAPKTDINVRDGHTFITAKKAVASQSEDNNITVKSVAVSGNNEAKSIAWFLGDLTCPNLSVDSSNKDHVSELYCGESSKLGNGSNTSLSINGYLYIPSISYFPMGNLTIGQFGSYTYNGSTTINGNIEIQKGASDSTGLLFINGVATVNGTITNNGKMYLYGGLYFNSTASATQCDLTFGGDSDTFIGSNVPGGIGNITLNGYYKGDGNVYIENNVTIRGYYRGGHISSRDEAIFQQSGATYISGNVEVTSSDNGIYTRQDTIFSCKDLTVHSAVYNCGKMVLLGKLNYGENGGVSDGDGFSLRNGGSEGTTSAELYIHGGSTVTLAGAMQNWGKLYTNCGFNVRGWHSGTYGVCAIINQDGAIAHFGNTGNAADTSYININTNSNAIYNGVNSVFTTKGGVDYGIVILNQGKFVALGDICQKQNGTVNTKKYKDSSSFSLSNGALNFSGNCPTYPNSVVYCGGTITLGSDEAAGVAGSIMNIGSIYVKGSLYEYTSGNSSVTGSANSLHNVAVYSVSGSNIIVGEDFFAGAAVATGNNTVCAVGGDFVSTRSLKINANFGAKGNFENAYFNFNNDDKFQQAYFYVGGNLIANKNGKNLWNNGTYGYPSNSSRDMDVYSNTNIYVGGSMHVNSKLYLKQNVTLVVHGSKNITETKNANGEAYINPNIFNNSDEYNLYIKQCLDENICSRMFVNGNMYVSDTCKIRDMAKNWIYGDFKCNSYVEIGKSLNDDNADESQATTDTYKANGENKKAYYFSNAGEMNVFGDFQSARYTKLYASTTLRVGGDFVSYNYLTLRHDAKIYVGKKLKATSSIDGGSYSEFHVAGSMQSETSNIKIRDAVLCVVGGNMTALSYIELGKMGDYARHIHTNGDGTFTVNETDVHGIHVSEGSEDNYGSDSNDQENNKTGDGSGATNENVTGGEEVIDTNTIDAADELAKDESDNALGSEFYVGKVLASYTSYIKEFSYSRVVVGEYVFTPKYLTLRHNSDMWVMPETFNNTTYIHKSYVSQSDGTFWGDLWDRMNEFAYNVSQFFTPKAGSIYTLGELTLNKNASLMGSYDCVVQGQCVLRPDALVYMGHNFNLTAPQFNVGLSQITGWITGKETSTWGFDTYGMASATYELVCPYKADHTGKSEGKWYKSIILADKYDPSQTYHCQLCGREIEKEYITAKQQTYPVVVYADNDVNILTTTDMKLTYVIANMGDINLYDVYSNSNNANTNITMLPNAMASFHGDINYFAIYGKIASLFYCPEGNLDLDGYYMELWGCGIGNTVKVNTYYLALHRFTNWRTMKLDIATAGNVYIIPQSEYDIQQDNTDEAIGSNPIPDNSAGGASLFFDLDPVNEEVQVTQ